MICEQFIIDYPTHDCIKYSGNKTKLTEKANGMEFMLNNMSRKKIMVIKVDDCIIKEEQMKCDYLFINCNDARLYFVELKGKDILKAIEQIEMTIKYFKENKYFKESKSINAYIVSSKVSVPESILSTRTFKLKDYLERNAGELKIRVNKCEVKS